MGGYTGTTIFFAQTEHTHTVVKNAGSLNIKAPSTVGRTNQLASTHNAHVGAHTCRGALGNKCRVTKR